MPSDGVHSSQQNCRERGVGRHGGLEAASCGPRLIALSAPRFIVHVAGLSIEVDPRPAHRQQIGDALLARITAVNAFVEATRCVLIRR